MVVVCLAGIIGSFLTSYTRARAEALGLDAKVGMLQRPERVVLLSVPQAFFGLALNGWVLALIIIFLTVTAWITVVQRVAFVYHQTAPRAEAETLRFADGEKPRWLRRRRSVSGSLLKGD
jgi:phosphatidylglycerophosphate synthase